jgi:hypothetical protein
MTATRVSWGQAFWAVVGATLFAFCATLLVLVPLWLVGLAIPSSEGVPGRGWPWRIDGPWSLLADVGPLLLSGLLFACAAEWFTRPRGGVPTRRAPIALTAATLGWVALGGVSNAGLVGVGGGATFVALVVVTREMSGRARTPLRWTRARVVAAVAVTAALAGATISYGLLHPLSLSSAEVWSTKGGVTRVITHLHNEGRAEVTVLSMTVPGVRTRALTDPVDPTLSSYAFESSPDDPDGGMVPIAGRRFLHERSRSVELVVPIAECPTTRIIDRVHVRLRVHGRTVDQVVRLAPVPVGCR